MSGKQPQRLTVLLAAAVLGLVLPHMLGAGYVLLLLLALPVIAAVTAQYSLLSQERFDAWRLGGYALVAGLALMTLPVLPDSLTLPAWLLPPLMIWLGAAAVQLTMPERLRGIRRAVYWACVCAAMAIAALAMAGLRYDGRIIPGLAESVTARIRSAGVFEKPKLLTMLYSSGLARLDDKSAAMLKAGVSVGGMLGFSPQLQEELLLSFGTTMRVLLPSLLPKALIYHGLLTVTLTTLAGEYVLRAAGRPGDLPRFSAWYMPTGFGRGMMAMVTMGLLPMLTDNAAAGMLGSLCNTLGYWAFAIQGAALMRSLMISAGRSRGMGIFMTVLGVLFAPMVLVLLGLFDQFRDPRALRGDFTDDNDD